MTWMKLRHVFTQNCAVIMVFTTDPLYPNWDKFFSDLIVKLSLIGLFFSTANQPIAFRVRNLSPISLRFPAKRNTCRRKHLKMEKKQKDLLRRNRLALVEDLEATQLLNFLLQEDGGLSERDLETIKAQPTRIAQAEKLLDILPRRGPKVFNVFCRALANTDGQQHLVDLLKPNEPVVSGNYSFNSATSQSESSLNRPYSSFFEVLAR